MSHFTACPAGDLIRLSRIVSGRPLMPQKLFPARKKCLTCGRTLGRTLRDPVYDGLYCSLSCAGIATPPRTAAGVRPIRPAELEEPDRGGFDPDALFAVMRVLHLRPGVVIEGARS